MGYSTDFFGSFELDKPLTVEHLNTLKQFSHDRHEPGSSPDLPEWGYYCQWTPTDDGREIEWDQDEKFYNYVEWLTYLVEHFLKPWGYVLNGQVEWQGESRDDMGLLVVTDNIVTTKQGHVEYQ